MSSIARPGNQVGVHRSAFGTVLVMIGVVLAYYVAAKLGLRLALVGENVTPIWPPTGIALAALLIFGYRMWPAIAVAAFAVNAPISPSIGVAVVIAVGNTLAPVAAAFLLRRLDFHPEMDRLRDVLALVLGAALAAMTISATVGSTTLVASGTIPPLAFWSTWAVWWTGDAMGVLVFAPLFLMLGTARPSAALSLPRRAEAIALLASIAVVAKIVFASDLSLLYLVFPLVVLAAWRFQNRGAAPAVLIASFIAVLAAVDGSGPFAAGTLLERMITLQAFNGGIALTAFLLAAMTSERMATLMALERARAGLEERVSQRTAELQSALEGHESIGRRLEEAQEVAHVGSWEWDIPTNVVTWTDELFRLYGLEPQSIRVDFEAFVSRLHPDDQEMVDRTVRGAVGDLQPFNFDQRVMLPSGTTIWLHCRGKVMADEKGRAIKMRGTAQDISERKKAEEYLARLNEAETRRQQGLELNDEVVQGLVVAKYALDLGQGDTVRGAVEATLESARKIVNELLSIGPDLQPGDLIIKKETAIRPGGGDKQ